MLRYCLLLLSLVAATTSAGGCRSCSTCHDYGPPVANCDCHACGTHRAGSASGGYVEPGYYEEGRSRESHEGLHESAEELIPPQPIDLPQPNDSPAMDQPEGVR